MQLIYRGKNYNNVDRQKLFQPYKVVGAQKQVPLLNGQSVPQVFLDNAASTKPFQGVNDFMAQSNLIDSFLEPAETSCSKYNC